MHNDHVAVLLEDIDSTQKLILELVQTLAEDMSSVKKSLATHSSKLVQLDAVVPLVKEHDKRLQKHWLHISKLEMPGRA